MGGAHIGERGGGEHTDTEREGGRDIHRGKGGGGRTDRERKGVRGTQRGREMGTER